MTAVLHLEDFPWPESGILGSGHEAGRLEGEHVLGGPRRLHDVAEGVGDERGKDPRAQEPLALRVRAERARLLLRVLREVEIQLVGLGAEAADVLVPVRPQTMGHDPAVADLRRRRRVLHPAREHGLERTTRHHRSRGDGQPLALQHGGQYVEDLHLLGDAPARRAATGELYDEGHPNQLVEDAPPVQPLAVVEELLAVIPQEHEERLVVEPAALQLAQEAAELEVAVGDLAVVLRHEALAVLRLLVVGARVLARVLGSRVGLELPVERGRGRVGDVRIHGVDVQERGQAPARVEPGERPVDHGRRLHDLRGPIFLAVQALEVVEALVEVRLGQIDDGVGEGRARRVAPGLQHLGQGQEAVVETVAKLHRPVLPRGQRREERSHRGLGPGRGRDGLVEDDGVLREGVELRSGVAGVAVRAGVVGAQGVHEIDDHQRCRRACFGHRRRPPEGPLRLAPLLVPAGLQDEVGRSRVPGEVGLGRDPAPVGGVLEGVEEARPHGFLAPSASGLHHELDPRPIVEALTDRAAEAEPCALRQVEAEAQPAGRSRREGAVEDFVHAHGRAEVGEHRLPVEAGHARLDEGRARAEEVHGPALGCAGGSPGAESQGGKMAGSAQTSIMKDGSKPRQTRGERAVLSCLPP